MPLESPTHIGPFSRAAVPPNVTMPDNDRQPLHSPLSTPAGPLASDHHESSGSPQRPSYSPVTPTLSHASLATQDDARVELPPSQWMEEPAALPVSLDDNSDAIALRAALSILQIQRQQALQDMRNLDKMKQAALQDPEQFVKDLEEGKLSRPAHVGVEVDGLEPAAGGRKEDDVSRFGKFPSAQNVARCPPVEWAKYHIVGEPLDRMHEVQQQHPGFTEEMHETPDRPQPHAIAAPYRPFADRLEGAKPDAKNLTLGP